MADVEMDLDPSRSIGQHDDHVDEDLIEYDLDTDVMEGTNNEWAEEDLEIQDVEDSHLDNDVDAHAQMETLLDDATDQPPDVMDTFDALPFPGTPANDAEMLSDLGLEGHLAQEDTEELHDADVLEEPAVEVTTTEQDISVVDDQQGGNIEEPPAQQTAEVEEIDFGTVPEDTAGADSLEIGVSPRKEEEKAEEVAVNPDDDVHTAVATSDEQAEVPAVEEELTWEEEEEEEEDEQNEASATVQPTSDGQAKGQGQTLQDDSATSRNPYDEEHQPLQAVTANAGSAETGNGQENLQEDNKATSIEDHEVSQQQEASPKAVDKDISYPSITVQYKGEEFPCFAGSDGFFTSTSVLEESMERLLAGFRTELAAELAPDEELVFHIDELGLEFAESTQQDILAGTSLQYVLEIYEMLVQNQDHDHDAGSKTLYTYLFTRSSTSKRLEFLAESAANGRGLDEVIHLFEPGMTHHGVSDSPNDTPGVLDEQGDDYPSPGDEPIGGDGGDYARNDGTPEPEHASADEHEEEAIANSLPANAETIDTNESTEEPKVVPGESEQAEAAAEPTDEEASPHPVELEPSNEFTEQSGADDYEVETSGNGQSESGGNHAENHDYNLKATEAPTTATSTSSTVDGNEIPPLSAIDESVEGEVDSPLVSSLEGEDDLVEIDWREEGDDEADNQTTPAKRARADDDQGFDKENDAKRQRSS